jgi:hypothetical protein
MKSSESVVAEGHHALDKKAIEAISMYFVQKGTVSWLSLNKYQTTILPLT